MKKSKNKTWFSLEFDQLFKRKEEKAKWLAKCHKAIRQYTSWGEEFIRVLKYTELKMGIISI
jgi:hypothetical protein